MPRPLSPAATSEKNALSSANPWIVLVEVQVPTSPLTRFRLAYNREAVTWQGQTYYAADIQFQGAQEDAEGGFTELELTVANTTRDVIPYLEEFDLSGQPARLIVVSKADLPSGAAAIDDPYRVIRVAASEEAVKVTLGQWNAYQHAFPGAIAAREHCRYQYRGARCGYAGALDICDKTRTGANGCEAHGVDSADHPRRFGGFPLMPRGGGLT